VRFSPALYDSITVSCGDDHCLSFGGLDRAVSRNEESLTAAVAAARLAVAPSNVAARIHLNVQQERSDGVVTIAASLRDTEGEFATMRIRRPDPDRTWSATLPNFVHYVLEHNPLAVMLYPRLEASRTPVTSFLQQAIDVAAAASTGEWRGSAQLVSEETVQPRRLVSGSPEARQATSRRSMDPLCAERARLVPPERGTRLGYVALAASPLRVPYPADASVVCRNDHLYVLTYGGEWGMHTFHRYTLDGASAGVYRVGYPDELPRVSAHSWLVDVESLEESEDRLTYAVDGWRREVVTRTPLWQEDLIHERRLIWQIPVQ
jgi:hypothetical protein